jgi:Transposase
VKKRRKAKRATRAPRRAGPQRRSGALRSTLNPSDRIEKTRGRAVKKRAAAARLIREADALETEIRQREAIALTSEAGKPRFRLKNIRYTAINLVVDSAEFKPVIKERRPEGRGAPRKIDLVDFEKDVDDNPDDSISQRAKRLGVTPDTVRRLLERRKHSSPVTFKKAAPILLVQ